MKFFCFIFLSCIYIFGDEVYPIDYLFIPHSDVCSFSDVCNTGYECSIDKDGYKHCIKKDTSTTESMYYVANDDYGNPVRARIYRYNDDSESIVLKKREEASFKRIIGDMDVIGASVIIPKIDGYNFLPQKNIGGKNKFSQTSQIVEKRFVNEEPSLGTTKFPNSSSAKFKFEEKSQYEKEHIDGSKIKYARLYWGGSLYKEWNIKTNYAATIFEDT